MPLYCCDAMLAIAMEEDCFASARVGPPPRGDDVINTSRCLGLTVVSRPKDFFLFIDFRARPVLTCERLFWGTTTRSRTT
jgi:hypothetical protein